MAKHICPGCEYIYDDEKGEPNEGYPAGMKFEELSDEFYCPGCAVMYKEDFIEIDVN
jgi:rubredoxin